MTSLDPTVEFTTDTVTKYHSDACFFYLFIHFISELNWSECFIVTMQEISQLEKIQHASTIYLRWINVFVQLQNVLNVKLPNATSSAINKYFQFIITGGPSGSPDNRETPALLRHMLENMLFCISLNTDLLCRRTGSKLCLMGSHTGADRAQTSGWGIDRRRGQSHNSWHILNNR